MVEGLLLKESIYIQDTAESNLDDTTKIIFLCYMLKVLYMILLKEDYLYTKYC